MPSANRSRFTCVVALALGLSLSGFASIKVMSSGLVYATLDEAVTNAATVDTLRVETGAYSIPTMVTIAKSLTISGGWDSAFTTQATDPLLTKFDGAAATPGRAVLVNGGVTVRLSTLTMENANLVTPPTGDSAHGGFAKFTALSNVTVDNCVVQNNQSASRGGGLWADNATLTVTNSLIKANKAVRCGGIYVGATAGTTLTVTDSVYDGNQNVGVDTIGAGSYVNNSIGTFTRVLFKNQLGGWAVSSAGAGSLININSCTFDNNDIGGMYFWSGPPTVFVRNSVMKNSSRGWGISTDTSKLTIEDCEIINNGTRGTVGDLSDASGGGVRLNSTEPCALVRSVVLDNNGQHGAGIYCAGSGQKTIDGVRVAGNYCYNVINIAGGSVADIKNSVIENNRGTPIDYWGDGSMAFAGNLENLLVRNNRGIVLIWGEKVNYLTNCRFEDNDNGVLGMNEMFMKLEGTTATLTNCTFRNNNVGGNTLLVIVPHGSVQANVEINNLLVENNVGRVMNVWNSIVNVRGAVVLNNDASQTWPGVFRTEASAQLLVENSFFENNNADGIIASTGGSQDGGPYTSVTVKGSKFFWNKGGGGFTTFDTVLDIENNALVGNEGGGIFIWGNASGVTSKVYNNLIANNVASDVAGGVSVVTNAIAELFNNTIINNEATNATLGGGGVLVDDMGYADLQNNVIWENQTAGQGKQILANNGGYVVTQTNDVASADVNDIVGAALGPNDLSVDPQVVSLTIPDGHLLPASPLIGAGTPIAAILTDLNGNTRYANPSIGAYEQIVGTQQLTTPDWTVNRPIDLGLFAKFVFTPTSGTDPRVVDYAPFYNDGYSLYGHLPAGTYDACVSVRYLDPVTLVTRPSRWVSQVAQVTATSGSSLVHTSIAMVGLGDTNGDGIVDDADITNVIIDFGSAGGASGDTDLNGDGIVDDADLTLTILKYAAENACP